MREWIDLIVEAELEEAGIAREIGRAATALGLMSAGAYNFVDKAEPAAITAPAPVDAATKESIQLLALTMWGEARSEGVEGMRAVGHVIANRAQSSRNFGDTIKDVVWKRKAFSCWNPSDPNRRAMENIAQLPNGDPAKVRYQQAMQVATDIVLGRDRDPTNGALFYHTKAITPYWVADDAQPVASIGSHLFYREDRKAS